MNQEWQEQLAALGLSVSPQHTDTADGGPASFDSSQLDAAVLVELSALSIVEIVGDDAQEFFQAQVCNDLALLSSGQLQVNGYCNPKGRLLALFTVYTHNDGYRLILPADVVEAFAKRLQMFVMRAKVSVTIRTDLVCSGIVLDAETGNEIMSDIAALPKPPAAELQLTENDAIQILRWQNSASDLPQQSTRARFICVATPEDMIALWQMDKFKHTGWNYWRWLDINAGLPNVFAASLEQFIPQMLNMQHINALSFKKGCYPGQEIVARMQYLGKLKKHMKHLRLPGATKAPSAGDVLSTASNNNAGQVVDAVLDEQGLNLLAVVNIETPVGDIQLFDQALQEASLPYALPAPADKDA